MLDRRVVDAVLARAPFAPTAEQAAAIRGLTSSGHGVESVEALAGTGKTFTAGLLAQAYSGPRWPWARGQRGGRAFSSPRAVSAIDSSRPVNASAFAHASGAMDTESPCFAAAETRKRPDVLHVPGEFDGGSNQEG